MAKGASKSAVEVLEDQEVSPVNTDDLDYALFEAERRVLEIQTKLHRWAGDDSGRRFDDLFNLVADPAFLLVAWGRVRGNKGARTAGVDGHTASSVALLMGVEDFLDRLRAALRDRSFRRLPVRERMLRKAGILGEDRVLRENNAGTPQGSILSPLLSNVALSVLDESIAEEPGGPGTSSYQRGQRRSHGLPNYRLIRYADDWCLVVSGTRADAEQLREQAATVLSTMGLQLSPEKTLITHIDKGLDFLGWRIQRHRKRGTDRYYVYTYPARKALMAVTGKVKTMCRRMDTGQPLDALLIRLNWVLRGWCAYFRPGVSSATFKYLSSYTWARVMRWLRRKHRRITVKELRRRFCGGDWWPETEERTLFNPAKVSTTRYRYRGTAIPSPWPSTR